MRSHKATSFSAPCYWETNLGVWGLKNPNGCFIWNIRVTLFARAPGPGKGLAIGSTGFPA